MNASLEKSLEIITLFTKKHLSWLSVAFNIYLIKVINSSQVTGSDAFLSHKGTQGSKLPSLPAD